jgi:hypothetical protein
MKDDIKRYLEGYMLKLTNLIQRNRKFQEDIYKVFLEASRGYG